MMHLLILKSDAHLVDHIATPTHYLEYSTVTGTVYVRWADYYSKNNKYFQFAVLTLDDDQYLIMHLILPKIATMPSWIAAELETTPYLGLHTAYIDDVVNIIKTFI